MADVKSAGQSSQAEKGRKRSLSPNDSIRARKRIKISSSELKNMKKEKIIHYWKEQDAVIDSLLAKLENSSAEEVIKLKDSEARLQSQVQELTRRENVLNMRLATKQEEVRNILAQLQDLKESQTAESTNLHSLTIDPAVNLLFQQMSSELKASREKLEQAQNDLSAWKFTPDSVTGKKLMSKCRSLLQENQDLGKQISQGRVAQLEAEIALHKKHCLELKETYEEVAEYVIQQDEESDMLLATILHQQQQIKDSPRPKKTDTASKAPPTVTAEGDRGGGGGGAEKAPPKINGPSPSSLGENSDSVRSQE
ncbi:PREDICTED: pre-mRNA-splicing regulator WTAP-like [Amphimedon queenslandica]|uniref:Pre-mRNA-splicing regulator WTAP n=1 Tax=Amphimedon queenslandica TaxID=400682 RepID=A0A1X7VMA1_AMPQE|nr:PREDICTED: pre-mRNA-splicing regulator WTAP-like [Amphimedon queenslandica]|eukprot:XP_019862866.1 PREDICTED: pre-mRNA-splicing regulator WTAP-like [Amphimedon queenslandica]